MNQQTLSITVYGAEAPCASCLNAPSSKDTKEWLEAAISRKYPSSSISIRYIDLYHPVTEDDRVFTEKILDDEYFYPLVVSEGDIIGEGDPKLKTIFAYLEQHGFKAVQ